MPGTHSKKMSTQTLIMNGQAKWSWSGFSRVKKVNTTGTLQHIVCRIPRDAFRQSAMTFGEVRSSSNISRYWNMSLQLFLEVLKETNKTAKTHMNSSNLPDIIQKVYLEWIPTEHDHEKASEYRIHAFLFDNTEIGYGKILYEILRQNNDAHEDSLTRSMNSRKPDALSALSDWQLHKRVTSEVYFRHICGLACGHRRVENNLDAVSSHKNNITSESNIANPIYIWSLKNACSNCKNPKFTQEDDNFVNGHFAFADTNRVVRLCDSHLFSKTFLGKYLPDYQSFIDRHIKPTQHLDLPDGYKPSDEENPVPVNAKDVPVRENDDRLDLTVYGENDISTVSEQEQARIDSYTSRSDFVLMAESAKNEYHNVQDFEGESSFPKRYRNYQKLIMKQMKSRCLNKDANISEKGQVILKWMERRRIPDYEHLYKFDRSLSLFANRVIKIMEEAEQYFLISTAHREFYQVMHARYDAYRRDFGLHLNIFQTGEGATSKSFLFDLMKQCSIEGTIDQLTYETAKANAVDGNRNDCITVCHEAPPGMFRASKNRNMDNGMEAMFKERLTSNHVSCKTFCFDEATGKRTQRITKSECIGVWFGATNDPRSEVEEALESRFLWGNFEKIKRPGKDIDDCINGERALSRTDKERRDEIVLEWKEEQARVFIVEKMIWCGVIKDVDMSAFYIIKQKFKKLFDGKSVLSADTRDWQRIFIFARVQAICTALTAVFQVEGGTYYGVPFEEDLLMAIEPFLVCTEEMVYFTLTMMDSQFVHPAEHKILKTVYQYHKKAGKLLFGNPKPDTSESTAIDYNYIKMKGPLSNIARSIKSVMKSQEGKTSENNIQAYLISLTKASVKSKQHVLPADATEHTYPKELNEGHQKRMMSAYDTGDYYYFHVKLLQNHKERHYDPVLETIQRIQHTHQKEKKCIIARRFFFNGDVIKEQKYHLFQVIERKPIQANKVNGVDKNTIKYINVLHNSKESKMILGQSVDDESRKQKEVVIDMDFDDWAIKEREQTLGKTIQDYEQWGIRTNVPTISYPGGMVRKLKDADSIAFLNLIKKVTKDIDEYFEQNQEMKNKNSVPSKIVRKIFQKNGILNLNDIKNIKENIKSRKKIIFLTPNGDKSKSSNNNSAVNNAVGSSSKKRKADAHPDAPPPYKPNQYESAY